MELEAERRLVERLKQGDESAFDGIYDAYRRRLYAFLLQLTRRPDVAEDLLEEIWLRLVRRIDTLRDDTRLGPWLFAVAHNLFVSHVRSRQPEVAFDLEVGELTIADPRPSPLETIAMSELQRRVSGALARLPAPSREVLLLVGVHGLSIANAAAVCGLSPDALRQRLSRARAALASTLGEPRARK